jgi:flagellar biosynthesis protein FlhG
MHPNPAPDAPADQAAGLRRLFGAAAPRWLVLVSNPHVAFGSVMLARVAAMLAASRRPVLVVDASELSPAPREWAALDLAAGIEPLAPGVRYLAARGLPRAHLDARGSAAGFLDAIEAADTAAGPGALRLLHADALDLARLLPGRALRPMLAAADHPESIKHAYAACKLLAQRCGLMTFDLLLAAAPGSRRVPGIASTLARCADGFFGAVLHDWAVVDPAGGDTAAEAALARLLARQAGDPAPAPAAVPAPGAVPAARSAHPTRPSRPVRVRPPRAPAPAHPPAPPHLHPHP